MNHDELLNHINHRFDRVEDSLVRVDGKLDTHLDRISKAEASIDWLRGHAKISITIVLAIVSSLLGLVINGGM